MFSVLRGGDAPWPERLALASRAATGCDRRGCAAHADRREQRQIWRTRFGRNSAGWSRDLGAIVVSPVDRHAGRALRDSHSADCDRQPKCASDGSPGALGEALVASGAATARVATVIVCN